MSTLGYKLAREGNNPGKSCLIVNQPGKSIEEYSSMHFTLG